MLRLVVPLVLTAVLALNGLVAPTVARATGSNGVTQAGGGGVAVVINARNYKSVDPTKLRRGDVFKAQMQRVGNPTIPASRSVFVHALSELAQVPPSDVQRYGLVKEISFSAIADLQTYVADPAWPSDVASVEYDFEGGMTPAAEYSNPVGSAQQFAAIAHAHGLTMMFTPIGVMLDNLISKGGLVQIGSQINVAGYQGQKHLQTLGQSAFLAEVHKDSVAVRGQGEHFLMQLGFTYQTCPEMVNLFTLTAADLDYAAIGTHSDVPCVLAGLRP